MFTALLVYLFFIGDGHNYENNQTFDWMKVEPDHSFPIKKLVVEGLAILFFFLSLIAYYFES